MASSSIATLFKAFLGQSSHVFSYRDDFPGLWDLTGLFNKLAVDGTESDLILVWDGVPKTVSSNPYAINVADHLTAFDWLVALCCAMNQMTLPPKLRVFLLDLQPPEHFTAFAAHTFPQFLSRLPWVRVYRPAAVYEETIKAITNEDFLRSHVGPDSLGADSLLADLGVGTSNPTTSLPYFKKDPETAQLLRQVWQGRLSRPEDRHSIANLIGPQILLQAMNVEARAGQLVPAVVALRTLLNSLELVVPPTHEERPPWIEIEDDTTIDQFMLVDDMAFLGWKDFLLAALGIPDRRLVICEKPDIAIPELNAKSFVDLLVDKQTVEGSEGTRDILRVTKGLNLAGSGRRILFLDLRLFENRDIDEEFAFLARLCLLAAQAKVEDPDFPCKAAIGDLPWPGFTESDLNAINDGIGEKRRATNDYYLALTLLPRLVALVDPTLPIVLFSSTSQRIIVNALHQYGTIITDFDKPRFVGTLSGDLVAEARHKFVGVLKKALVYARGRNICDDLRKARADAEVEWDRWKSLTPDSKHFELYVEESGTPGSRQFSVGGLVIGYPSAQVAGDFHNHLATENLCWGWHRDDPVQNRIPPKFLKKSSAGVTPQTAHEVFSAFNRVAKAHSLQVALLMLGTTRSHTPIGTTWSGPDHIYRFLLRLAIEQVVFEWIPSVSHDPAQTTLSIFVATRMLEPDPSLVDVSRNFGVGLLETDDEKSSTRGVYVVENNIADFLKTVQREFVAFARPGRNLCAFVRAPTCPAGARPARKLLGFGFSDDDVYPMVEDVIAGRRTKRPLPRIGVARGVGFRYYVNPCNVTPDELPRQVHYLADWVLSYCLTQVPEHWKKRGIEEEVDKPLLGLVESCRLADAERGIDAIFEWHMGRRGKARIDKWAAVRVGGCLDGMTGIDFLGLCKRLEAGNKA